MQAEGGLREEMEEWKKGFSTGGGIDPKKLFLRDKQQDSKLAPEAILVSQYV